METFSVLLVLCAGNSPVTGDIFFDLRLNKQFSKQSWGWWFEMPSCPLWHHCNAIWWNFMALWRSMFLLDIWTMLRIINTFGPHHNNCHFADNILKCIFLHVKFCILIQIWLNFFPNGPINNKLALVQIKSWFQTGHKLLSEAMIV